MMTAVDIFQFVLNGQHDRLREVLASGLTPMLQRDGLTPLHLAAACDDLEAAAILVEAGAFVDVEAWPESSQPGAAVHSDLWGEVDRRTRRSFRGDNGLGALGCTPLHIACDRGCAPMARWLLERGASAYLDVYLDGGPEGFWDWSPLKLAVGQPGERPHPDVVVLLEQWARDRPKTDADEAVAEYRHRRVPK